MTATNAPIPEGMFSQEQMTFVSKYFKIYSTVMKCKALGIPPPKLSLQTLEYVYEIYDKVHEIHTNKK